MSTVSVSIDRTSLSLAALVISDDGTSYRLTEDGVGQVVQTVRVTTAPDSMNIDGAEIIAYARDATALTLEFHVLGTSSADLAAKIETLETALYRLDYSVTRTVDGVSKTWQGGPCALIPKRATVDSGVAAAHFETYSVTIPFPNPNGS